MNFSKIASMAMIALMGIGLSGCAAQLEQQATMKLQADCAARGLQFVQTNVQKTDNPIFSEAQVSGECVGPTDSRYKPPVPSP